MTRLWNSIRGWLCGMFCRHTGFQYGRNRLAPMPVPVIPPHMHRWDDWSKPYATETGMRMTRFCVVCSQWQDRTGPPAAGMDSLARE